MAIDPTWPVDGEKPWGEKLRDGLDEIVADVNSAASDETGTLGQRLELAYSPDAQAEAASDPDSNLYDAILEIATSVIASGTPFLYEATTLADARPTVAPGQAVWWIVVDDDPDVTPVNMVDGDMVIVRAEQPIYGIVVWSDDFARADGALGSTPVGGLTWNLAGTSVAAAIASGVAHFTAGTVPIYASVQTSYARTRFEVTSPANSSAGGIVFRYVDLSNRYAIVRTSAGDATARLVKVVAGTQTVVKTFTGYLINASANRYVIDDRVLGELKIYINGNLVFDETVDTGVSVSALASQATPSCGVTFVTGTGYSGFTWDDLILYRAV